MSDAMTDNENPRSRSRLGRPRPHDLGFRVNLIGGTLLTALITLGSAEGFSPGSEALSVRALGAVFNVSQPYGAVDKEVNATPGGVHAGIDFAAPRATAVRAVRDGTVINAGGPYGTVGVFDGENTVLYIHMQDIDVSKLNERITVGTFLGAVGRVGATGVHLHIEVRKGRHEVGVGCTVDEYVKMWPKKTWPKGYCDSPRRVADLTLDPVEYVIVAPRAEGRQVLAQTKGGTSGAEDVVWFIYEETQSCKKDSGQYHLIVSGKVSPAIDLTNEQTAKAFVELGKEYALAKCPILGQPRQLVVSLYTPRYRDGQTEAVEENFVLEKSGNIQPGRYSNWIAAEAKEKQERIAAEAKQEQAKNAWCRQWIEPFLKKYRVDVWMGSADIANRFLANPFQYEKKIVGFRAEFQRMGTRDTGAFLFAGWLGGLMSPIVVTGIPPTRFVKSNEVVLLAGRVQGVTEGAPVLVFIGAEPGPPMDQLSSGIPECTKGR